MINQPRKIPLRGTTGQAKIFMLNQAIAKIFYQMSEYYAMDEVAFKPQAYEKAARLIEGMEDDLNDIYKQGGIKALMAIDGVGRSMAEKIEEYIKTGQIKEYAKLKKACPVDLERLSMVQGLGPKSIKTLYAKLRVKTLADLAKAAHAGKIANLSRFGEKAQENILRGIEYVKSGQGRIPLGYILPLARKFEERLAAIRGVEAAVAAGSVRRRKETVGDIDVLAITDNPAKVMDYFCSLAEVEEVLAKGKTKSTVRLHNQIEADLRVVPEKSFGAALQYFTGNKDHNIELRRIAEEKGYKLNEYGLYKIKNQRSNIKNTNQISKINEKIIAGKTEKEIYEKLGLQYIEPEMRENTGEIELALENKLPSLVKYEDVKGDLQTHSTWSDGAYTIQEMAEAAKKLGRKYVAITDHAGRLAIAGGLKEKELLKQMAEIDKVNKKIKGIRVLKGAEVDIDKDGALHIKDEVLAKMDIVLGAIHDNFKMSKEAMTERICRAMANPHVDILAHPTGRLLGRREGYEVDWDKVFGQAIKTGTVIEINAYPERLDLSWQNVKRALELGVKLSLGTDAHSVSHLEYLELGVSVARRGWAEKGDIINTMNFEELMRFLKQHKK